MADIIDKGNDTAEHYLNVALKNKKVEGPSANVDSCYYCSEPTAYGRRWCDAACRDDWMKLDDLEKQHILQDKVSIIEACNDEE